MTKKWSKVSRSIFEQKQYYKQCPCQSEESLEEEESSTEEEEEVEDSEESSSLFEGSSRNEEPGVATLRGAFVSTVVPFLVFCTVSPKDTSLETFSSSKL